MNNPHPNPLPPAGEGANVKSNLESLGEGANVKPLSLTDAHTFDLCEKAVDATSMTAVALAIGYSRTAISLYLSGKYGAGAEKLEAAIRAQYDRYDCLHTGIEISGPDCNRRASAPRPFGGRAKEAHWLSCQHCHYNKNHQGEPS